MHVDEILVGGIAGQMGDPATGNGASKTGLVGDHALVFDRVAIDVLGMLELTALEVTGRATAERIREVNRGSGSQLRHSLPGF